MSELTTTDRTALLIARGMNSSVASSLVEQLDAEAIMRTVRWFDEQNGRVGIGVLVAELRAGGKPAAAKPLLDAQYDYGESIVQWLRKYFPEWNHDGGNRTHSAAIAEVIRLHHRDGKNALTPSKHGPEIRAAVNAFNERYL